jgi:hypothetical protein
MTTQPKKEPRLPLRGFVVVVDGVAGKDIGEAAAWKHFLANKRRDVDMIRDGVVVARARVGPEPS